MKYFSDKYESDENISIDVWNGIVSLYEELIISNHFAKSFPEICNDNGMPCGVNENNLENAIKAEIPNIKTPIRPLKKEYEGPFSDIDEKINTISLSILVDFIEFMFANLSNPKNVGKYHEYMNHFHLQFSPNKSEIEKYFIDKVNTIFRRNFLPYFIGKNGEIQRLVDNSISLLIEKEQFFTKDEDLNNLLNKAFRKFKSSKKEDRREALDILWDAFERLKTHYGADKQVKKSIEIIIESVSFDHKELKEAINNDADILNSVGNKTDIRHKNTIVEKIENEAHIDYLFFRMSNLIHLMLKHFEINEG